MKQKQKRLSLKHLVQSFVMSRCELEEEYEVEQPILYEAFQEWCIAYNSRFYSKRAFTSALEYCTFPPISSKVWPRTTKSKRKIGYSKPIKMYQGIRLKQSA